MVIDLAGSPTEEAIRTCDIASTMGFERAYQLFYPVALRWATALAGSDDTGADIVHDSFVRIFARERVLRDERAFAAYLRRTVVRTAASRWRSDARWRRRTEVAARDAVADPQAVDTDPELVAAVKRLPHRQRMVVIMRFWLDWSERDIAAALGCRPGTVKSLSARALDELRREVAQ